MRYYHGTDWNDMTLNNENPSSRQQDLCLTDDSDIAANYATRYGQGYLYEIWVDLDASEIATEEQALTILCGIDADEIKFMSPSDKFHAIDQLTTQEVIEAGYKAVTYEDCMPGTAEKFECLRVYDYSVLEIESMEAI